MMMPPEQFHAGMDRFVKTLWHLILMKINPAVAIRLDLKTAAQERSDAPRPARSRADVRGELRNGR